MIHACFGEFAGCFYENSGRRHGEIVSIEYERLRRV